MSGSPWGCCLAGGWCRNPGLRTDWRLRLHHGAARLDVESPRISDEELEALRQARGAADFEARVRETGWRALWMEMSGEVRGEVMRMILIDEV